jgi:D-serine deaminase-like pyridoxal phosphate-dependent protein
MEMTLLDYGKFMTPYLAIELDAFSRNIDRMKAFSEDTGTSIRPHVKTHKCSEIAKRQIAAGAIGVTCAKLGEAEAMVSRGIKDVLIANQVVGKEKLTRLARLAQIADIKVSVDSPAQLSAISEAAALIGSHVGIVVEVDVGMGRCGVREFEQADELADLCRSLPGLCFRGVLGYEGHCVLKSDRDERLRMCTEANSRLVSFADRLRRNGHQVEIVSAGGTGTYDMTGRYTGITEVEAGSYVFMDTTYASIGLPFEQSLFIVATVVSTPETGVIILDTGLKTMTTEFGRPSPAYILRCCDEGADALDQVSSSQLRVKGVSEEHTTLIADDGRFSCQMGDKVLIVPTHCCTTVNLYDEYKVFRSGQFIEKWAVEARGKSY